MAQPSTTGRYTSDITLQLCFSILKIPTVLFLIIGSREVSWVPCSSWTRGQDHVKWVDVIPIDYKEIPLMKMGNYLLNNSWSCTFKYNYVVQAWVDEGVRSRRRLIAEWDVPPEMRFCDDSADSGWYGWDKVTRLKSGQFATRSWKGHSFKEIYSSKEISFKETSCEEISHEEIFLKIFLSKKFLSKGFLMKRFLSKRFLSEISFVEIIDCWLT